MTFEMYLVLGFGVLVIAALAINAFVNRKKRAPKSHYDVKSAPTYDVEGHREFSREFRQKLADDMESQSRPWK